MTEAKPLRIQSRLARQLALPGGVSVQEAVRRADARLEGQRESAMQEISAVVSQLDGLCRTRAGADEITAYDLATALVDVAGLLGAATLYQAAYSLCEVADRMTAQTRWDWSSVQVHVSALRLILNHTIDDDAVSLLLVSLASVNDHYGPR